MASRLARLVQHGQGGVAEALDPVEIDQVLVQGLARLFADIDQQQDVALGQDLPDLGIGGEKLVQAVAPGAPVAAEHQEDIPVLGAGFLHGGGDQRLHVGGGIIDRRLGFGLDLGGQDRRQQHQRGGQDQPEKLLVFGSIGCHRLYLLKGKIF